MTTALWCLMIAALLPIFCTGIAKWGFKGFDNNRPREWLARQQGWRARAHAAQQNSWEAFATRLLYIWCYVMDFANLRSLIWLVGLGLSISLFVISA
jgi:uncharacterized MAPEG superfamily protein